MQRVFRFKSPRPAQGWIVYFDIGVNYFSPQIPGEPYFQEKIYCYD